MIYAIFSDSHGNINSLKKAIEKSSKMTNIDKYIYLGDGLKDWHGAIALSDILNYKNTIAVRGNNDFIYKDENYDEIISDNNINIFISHGHKYNVKYTFDYICMQAFYSNSQIVLYGHTHCAYIGQKNGIFLINPGSCNFNETNYAILEIDKNGKYYGVLMK